MKLKAEEFIEVIDENELYKIKADLHNGAIIMKKLVEDKLRQLENKKRSFCATCGENLMEMENTLTLLFGPDDFRKKASFCAHDCMEYFLTDLKKTTTNKPQEQNHGVQ